MERGKSWPMLRNVLVSQLTAWKNGQGDKPAFGVSGLLLSDGWILTHGSLLSPNFFDTGSQDILNFILGIHLDMERDIVNVPRLISQTMRFKVEYKERNEEKTLVSADCSLRAIWRCPLLHRTFTELLFSWTFQKVAEYDKSLLSIFLLLRLDGSMNFATNQTIEAKHILNDFYSKSFDAVQRKEDLKRGASVETESTPFGNAVFLDSVSRGIVSNLLGEENCLILTDANAVPGCEGAAVYLVDENYPGRRRICGLVIASLSWCRGEWVDYTFAANLQTCLRKILRTSNKGYIADTLTRHARPSLQRQSLLLLLPDQFDKSVVVVKCDSGWGTGVVVDASTGTILTCSHVVREAPGSRIRIVLTDGEEWARLVYRTRDGQPFDVAVLKLERKHETMTALTLASDIPDKGASVFTIGYPFFSSSTASYSRGVISRLTCCMIQTTCCVQSGASGGPVICSRTGRMLGLIVSNTVSTASENADTVLYPKFNMAVPVTVLRKPIYEYVKTGDIRCLESLSSCDPTVQESWNFYLTPRSKM